MTHPAPMAVVLEEPPSETQELLVAVKENTVYLKSMMSNIKILTRKVSYVYDRMHAGEKDQIMSRFPIKSLADWDEVVKFIQEETPESPELAK